MRIAGTGRGSGGQRVYARGSSATIKPAAAMRLPRWNINDQVMKPPPEPPVT